MNSWPALQAVEFVSLVAISVCFLFVHTLTQKKTDLTHSFGLYLICKHSGPGY